MTRTCREPDCEVTWEVVKSGGRPRVWCDEHGSTKASSRRNRAKPKRPKSPCCPIRGRCPQHRRDQHLPQQRVRVNPFKQNRETLLDFVDVFGHAVILSERGWPIHVWLPKNDDD